MKHYHPIKRYFLPEPSRWPLIGSVGLFLLVIGIVNILHDHWFGHYLFMAGSLLVVYMMAGWFGVVITESEKGLHSIQMDRTYRFGMLWFIVSEAAFFGIFFGALFYERQVAVPMLGGLKGSPETHALLWPAFHATWPLFENPNPTLFQGPKEVIPALGLPAWNTFILLSSAVAVTVGHWGIKFNHRRLASISLLITILLGILFLSFQGYEYYEAHVDMNLTLSSGIYGTTFFMLTGFHAAHVTLGVVMLSVILFRCLKGHFLPEHHFGYEAVSWYWHFVDVIWLFLFIFVYWL
jgi:cytochrome c oxidase subunit 3